MAMRGPAFTVRLCQAGLSARASGATSHLARRTQCQAVLRRPFSSSPPEDTGGPVDLVYDMHKPAKPVTDSQTKPILFLHGLFGSKKNNRGMSKALARDLGRYVYTLDLRNHGESPRTKHHDYPSMAGDIAHFIQKHGLKESTIIGHSMGAKTAMTVALSTPELLSDVIPVDNAPVDAAIVGDFGGYVRAMKKIDAAHVTRQAEADKILAEIEPSLTIRQFLLGNMHHVPAHGSHGGHILQFRNPLDVIGKSLDLMGDFPFKDPNAIRFEKPALFVRGTDSHYVPDETIPVIGQFFPKFELVDVKAGHWLISENPEAFRQAVVRFLSPKD